MSLQLLYPLYFIPRATMLTEAFVVLLNGSLGQLLHSFPFRVQVYHTVIFLNHKLDQASAYHLYLDSHCLQNKGQSPYDCIQSSLLPTLLIFQLQSTYNCHMYVPCGQPASWLHGYASTCTPVSKLTFPSQEKSPFLLCSLGKIFSFFKIHFKCYLP